MNERSVKCNGYFINSQVKSEIFLGLMSMFLVDRLILIKPLIYLKYLAPHDLCVFEQYQACWVVNSQSELTDALRQIHLNSAYRPYRQENVDRLLEDAVYAGNRSRDILSDYAELIVNYRKSKFVGDKRT